MLSGGSFACRLRPRHARADMSNEQIEAAQARFRENLSLLSACAQPPAVRVGVAFGALSVEEQIVLALHLLAGASTLDSDAARRPR